jgi:Na+-transporting methylmalonyl-CoA/oxaloacetate decarboxylase gamma subunit
MIVSVPLMEKSVRFNRLKLALIASISLIVVANATLLVRMLSSSGSLMVPGLVFVFTFLPVFVVLLETMSHTNQNLTVFRSVGARKRTVAASILATLIGAGLVGALVGAGIGVLLAGAYTATTPVIALTSIGAVSVIQGTAYVLVSFVAGLATAVFLGVKFSWNKLAD